MFKDKISINKVRDWSVLEAGVLQGDAKGREVVFLNIGEYETKYNKSLYTAWMFMSHYVLLKQQKMILRVDLEKEIPLFFFDENGERVMPEVILTNDGRVYIF